METLRYDLLKSTDYEGYLLETAPERVLQFGEGNFLRGFVDYFIDVLNERCGFNGKICLCQPISQGLSQQINQQEGLYTLYLRGYENGQAVEHRRIISAVSRCINPYEDYAALLQCAKNPALRFLVSNTTEAGIVFDDRCRFEDAPPASFPAKLTRFLHQRFMEKLPGFIILSCELIDNNGAELRRCVLEYCKLWGLGADFVAFVEQENLFCSTLVDRIVTGYPRSEATALWEKNGYIDNLIDTAECFGFWAIEGPDFIGEELPFSAAGLPVLVTPNQTPYKQRKVRILNGAHTSMVLAAHLCGKTIVRACMEDPVIAGFMEKALREEIIPTLTLPKEELYSFADAVIERFKNPFIDHALLAIALNSTSKWRARVLPSLKAYLKATGTLPRLLTLSLGALIAFYKAETDKSANDESFVLDLFRQHRGSDNATLAHAVLASETIWGEDLSKIPGLLALVSTYLDDIDLGGMYEVLRNEQGR